MKFIKSKKTGVISVQFRTEHGIRTSRTGCTNAKDAAAVAKEAKVKELELAAKAARLTPQVISQIVAGKDITVSQAIEEWIKSMATDGVASRTIYNQRVTVEAWARDRRLATAPPSAVTADEIRVWINDKDSETKRSSRSVALSCLRSFFKFCAAQAYCLTNSAANVKVNLNLLSHQQKETRIKAIFSPEELGRLQRYLERQEQFLVGEINRLMAKLTIKEPGPRIKRLQHELANIRFWRVGSAIGRWTGLRLGDICQLEWDCFAVPERMNVWTDKRDRRVSLPVSLAAFKRDVKTHNLEFSAEQTEKIERYFKIMEFDLLTQIAGIPIGDKQYCFPERRERALNPSLRAVLSLQFARILARANVPGHSFHDFRHTYCTEMDQLGLPIEHISRAVGHTGSVTTRNYIHS